MSGKRLAVQCKELVSAGILPEQLFHAVMHQISGAECVKLLFFCFVFWIACADAVNQCVAKMILIFNPFRKILWKLPELGIF